MNLENKIFISNGKSIKLVDPFLYLKKIYEIYIRRLYKS